MVNASRITALMHWLQAGAPGPETFSEVVTEISGRLNAAGVPAAQVAVYKNMVHPELPAHLDHWTPGAGARISTFTSDIFTQTRWLGTPAQVCNSTGRTQIVTLGQAPEFDTHANSTTAAAIPINLYSHVFLLKPEESFRLSLFSSGLPMDRIDDVDRIGASFVRDRTT